MKSGWAYLKLLACALFFGGCGTTHAPLPTVETVDIEKYLGTWYEIGRYPNRFEKGCTAVTAEYTLEKESIIVTNRCHLLTPSGKEKVAKGKAEIVKNSNNAKLKVTFFWPFYGDYWIIRLDQNYRYAVVGEPSREYLWILARENRLSDEQKKEITAWLPEMGYEPGKIIWTQH